MKVKKRKLTRKELKEDSFTKFMKKMVILWNEKKKLVVGILAGIIVIAAGTSYFISSKRKAYRDANERLTYSILMVINGQMSDAYSQFDFITQQYYGTFPATKAMFYLANMDYQSGKIDQAMERFKSLTKLAKDRFILPSSYEGLGQCYEQKGDLNSALENYKKAEELFEYNSFKAEVLFNIARIYETQRKYSDAENAYKRILDIVKTPGLRNDALQRLKMVQGIRQVIGG